MKVDKDFYYCNRTPLMRSHLGLCLSQRAMDREIARLKIPKIEPIDPDSAAATTWTFTKNTAPRVVHIVQLAPQPEFDLELLMPLLAHEAVHVWQGERRYMKEDNPGLEIDAYYTQFFVSELLEAFFRLRPAYRPVAPSVAARKRRKR